MSTQPESMQNLAPALGIYVSIPFCRAKCSYCNFASGVYGDDRMEKYVEKLMAEIRDARERVTTLGGELPQALDSIYFGGGTPSLLKGKQIEIILKAIGEVFTAAGSTEITLECAPGHLSEDVLHAVPGLGFNRVSLGVQSFMDHEASAVGRTHTRAITLHDIDRLRAAGIDDINVDLIAGLPHQTRQSWRESLSEAIDTAVPHLSVYMLDVDEDSRLGREILAGGTRYGVGMVPNESTIADMYTEAVEQFDSAGIAQYEISNFSRAGHRSRHNLKYWTRQPYLGFGLDAHSFLPTASGDTIRVATTDDLTVYLDPHLPAHDRQTITAVSPVEAMEEAWFLGLRLNEGVSVADMAREFGASAVAAYQPVLRDAQQEGLMEYDEDRVRLTQNGRLFANDVFQRFLGVLDCEETAATLIQPQGVFA